MATLVTGPVDREILPYHLNILIANRFSQSDEYYKAITEQRNYLLEIVQGKWAYNLNLARWATYYFERLEDCTMFGMRYGVKPRDKNYIHYT